MSTVFKTTAKFRGKPTYIGCPVLIGLDLGAGVRVVYGVIGTIDETYGFTMADLSDQGDFSENPSIEASAVAWPFNSTADANGDPTTLTDQTWMFAANANIS